MLQWDLRAQQEHPLPASANGAVAYSPDGQLAAAVNEPAIVVWNVSSGERIWSWPSAAKSEVRCLAFSPDGEL